MPFITTRVTPATDATLKNEPLTNSEIDQNFINLNNAITLSGDVTGFADRVSSSLTFNTLTRTVSLAPTGANFTVYLRGKNYLISATKTLTIANSNGGRYIGYNVSTGNLEDVGATPNFATTIVVAYVYWNSTDSNAIIFADERHSVSRDTTWHAYQHTATGAIWKSGGNATYTINNTNTVQIGLSTPIVLADEDIEHTVADGTTGLPYTQQLTSPASLPILYLNGTTYRQTNPTTVPWYPSSTRAYYNAVSGGSGSLAIAPSNDMFLVYWIVLTHDSFYPVKLVMGRGVYSTYGDAETENFDAYDLPLPEIAPMYKVILKTSDTYTQNTGRINIVGFRELVGKQNARNNSFDTFSHDSLSDRFGPNQHSISSITDLQSTLDTVSGAAVAMAIALG
jgi:hypothetical protein